MDILQEILDLVAKALGLKNGLTLGEVVRVALIALVGYIVIRILMKMVDRLLERSKSMADVRVYIRSAVHIFLWALLALMLAGTLGVDVTSIIAMLSVVGLAVSLALQNTLSNLAGGLMVLVTKPFVVGDYVEIDGEITAGIVEEIGLAYTKLVTYDGRRISVPNSQVSGAKIINYTNQDGRRVDIKVSASYDAPTQTVKQALYEALAAIPAVRSDPAPAVWICEYGSSAIVYVIRAWTASEDYWPVYNALMEGIREAFERHGVEMTYDHINVHMVDRRD